MKEHPASDQFGDLTSREPEPLHPPLPTRVLPADLAVRPVRALDDVALLARVREGLERLA